METFQINDARVHCPDGYGLTGVIVHVHLAG